MDAGDAAGIASSDVDVQKFPLMISLMGRIGYDAMCPGDREIAFGVKTMLAEAKKAKLPLVAANLVYAGSKKPVVTPYLLLRKNGLRVAVFGVLGSDLALTTPAGDPDSVKILDPVATAKDLVPKLRKQADVVVMLAHTSYFPAQKIAQEAPGIDVVIVGHAPGQGDVPPSTSGPVYARSGQKGQSIAKTLVDLDDKRHITNLAVQLVTLGGEMRVDETILSIVKKFEDDLNDKQLKKQQQDALDKGQVPTIPAGDDRYLGDAVCQRCHSAIYDQWKTTKHAQGWKTLVDNKADGNPACIVCHVVGYKQPSGFISAAATPHLSNIQCEQCHGMATKHADYKEVTEATCKSCHIPERDPNWDFATRWEQIKH